MNRDNGSVKRCKSWWLWEKICMTFCPLSGHRPSNIEYVDMPDIFRLTFASIIEVEVVISGSYFQTPGSSRARGETTDNCRHYKWVTLFRILWQNDDSDLDGQTFPFFVDVSRTTAGL